MTRKRLKPPICQHCHDVEAVLATGVTIYLRRGDLAAQWFWRCSDCGAYTGCHKGTKKSLGRPANKELRDARIKLHNLRIDPIWRNAISAVGYDPEDARAAKIIMNAARSRTYAFIAEKLGLDKPSCHVAMFGLDQCRAAWRALNGIDYAVIRDWYKSREAAIAVDKTNEHVARQ